MLSKNPDSLQILLKTTKIFNNNHYLLIIYKKETIIGEPGQFNFDTYEEYETSYLFELKLLSSVNNSEKQTFSLSEDECGDLFHLRNSDQIVSFIQNKLSFHNDLIMLPIRKNIAITTMAEYEGRGFLLYFQRAIDLVQKYIINRKFNLAYKKYKSEEEELTDIIIHKETLNIETHWYHAIICYQ